MASTFIAASGFTSTAAYTLSYSTTHLGWGPNGWNFLLSIHKSSWGILPLCSNSLLQLIIIVCCAGIILVHLSSGALAILIGFNIRSLISFTVIFVRIHTWGSGRYLYSPPDLGIIGSWLEYFFISSILLGRSDVGLVSCFRCSDGLIFDNVVIFCKLYGIMF